MLMNIIDTRQLCMRKVLALFFIALLAACSSSPKKEVAEQVVEAPPKVLEKPVLTEEEKTSYQEAVRLITEKSYPEATDILQGLLAAHPNLAGAHANLGLIAQANENQAEAVEHFKKALAANPYNAEASIQLALIHQDKGEFKASEDLLVKVLSKQPAHLIANYNLGVLYELYLRDYDKAITHYQVYVNNAQDEDKKTVERWIKILERK